MKRKTANDLGIETVSEFGALTHYDEIWLVDRRENVTECGAVMSYGEIWRVDSHDRATALAIADSEGAPDSEVPNGGNHKETQPKSGHCDLLINVDPSATFSSVTTAHASCR